MGRVAAILWQWHKLAYVFSEMSAALGLVLSGVMLAIVPQLSPSALCCSFMEKFSFCRYRDTGTDKTLKMPPVEAQ